MIFGWVPDPYVLSNPWVIFGLALRYAWRRW